MEAKSKWSNHILDTWIFVHCPSGLCSSHSNHPPSWILKQGGLESSGQRLISSISKTKIIAFLCFFNFQIFEDFFFYVWRTEGNLCVTFRIWGLCLSVAGPCPTVADRPYTSNKGQDTHKRQETTVEGRKKGGRKKEEGNTGAVKKEDRAALQWRYYRD